MMFDLSKVVLGGVYRYGDTDLLVLSVEKISDFEFKTVMQHGVCVGSSHVTLKDEVIGSFVVITKDGKMYHLENNFKWRPLQKGVWEFEYEETKYNDRYVVGHSLTEFWWNKVKDELPMTKADFLVFFEPETAKEISKMIGV